MNALNDKSDPILKDVSGEEGRQAIIARSLAWVAKQPKAVQRLFCEHGSYVGHNRALAYLCPRCPEA